MQQACHPQGIGVAAVALRGTECGERGASLAVSEARALAGGKYAH